MLRNIADPLVSDPSATGGALDGSTVTVLASALEHPELDDRSYRVIRLQNDLEALLIHDPDTDKSSAALDVRVGSFSDPRDLQGLAHFCEHLLFMGTVKYPKENDYSEYLSSHSGRSNAYTDSCDTNYFFEVNHEFLEGALDRFAQFFISPLFSIECKDREIRAVDSENKKNLQSDLWRLYQLDKSLSNPDHPYSSFSTGNLETLDAIPSSKGIDVREELLKFHEMYYSANLMKLVVLGREPLDKLEQWTVEKFSAVRNNKAEAPKFKGSAISQEQMQIEIFAKPVMDDRSLEISFMFPDQKPLFASHPAQYFSHLIGHEGPGSILQYLKSKSWANSLSAGSHNICDGSEIFSVSVDLTNEGLKVYEDVIVTIFQYLKLLQQTPPQEWIYEELRDIAASNFRFRQKAPASSTTSKLAAVMQRSLPREWLLSGPALYRKFDSEALMDSVKYFTPDSFRFSLTSQIFPGDWDQTEKWYGTEYKVTSLSDDLLKKIKDAPLNPALHLPTRNEFIATDFEVERKEAAVSTKQPILIRDQGGSRLWFKKDDTFWVPKASVHIQFRNPIVTSTPENLVKSRLFTELVSDALNAYGYAASIAGLSYQVELGASGIFISAQGFNHKLSVLLQKILEKISTYQVDPDRFEVIREKIHQEYRNSLYGTPYYQVGSYTSYLLSEFSFLTEEKLTELEAVSAEDVQHFIHQVLKQFNTEILVHGNLSKEEALKISDAVDDQIQHRPLPKSLDIRPRSLVLTEGAQYAYKRLLEDKRNINSCIEYYIQVCGDTDRENRAILGIISQIGSEPAFNQLRTKEQLGYVVFSGIRVSRTMDGYRVLIQSERTTEFLETRIDYFLDQFGNIIKELTDEEYQKHVQSLIAKKLEKPKNLGEETGRYWGRILSGFYDFDRNERDVEVLSNITKAQVVDLYYKYIHPSSPSQSTIVVQLQSQCAPAPPDLQTILKAQLPEFWKESELPAEKQISTDELEGIARSDDPVASMKKYFIDTGLEESWENEGKSFIMGAIKFSAAPLEKVNQTLIEDVGLFKSSLPVSTAPVPTKNLLEYREIDPKL
ncbi:Metalloenzyme, LuxS/M16 peptidase-like protein [Lipomyces oligophaga]|uniref:Metalloenzyme, LuxS/M16 peptidase-like protein n=1 Tax=Lipomyces oligophaga TaxID=45792 RepID=UPI0034CE3803